MSARHITHADIALAKTLLDYNPETGVFTWLAKRAQESAGNIAGSQSTWGYLRIGINGRRFSAHRLAWAMFYGSDAEHQLDHIDGNKTNNAISNLRLATASLNQLYNNKPRKESSTGLVGVFKTRGSMFRAQIKVRGSTIYLGQFECPEAAYSAYCKAKISAIAEQAMIHGIAAPAAKG